MKDFFKSLFNLENELEFKYKDYDMMMYSAEFKSYYLIFFINNQNDMIDLWNQTEDVFTEIKKNDAIYRVEMDKNINCIFCLKISEEEYYKTGETGKISELSKVISAIEEDLNYYVKHVFLYTEAMEEIAKNNVGRFESMCKTYLKNEEFDKFKNDIKNNVEYDFLMNLFIKLPFLSTDNYFDRANGYQTVDSLIQNKINARGLDMDKLAMKMDTIDRYENDMEKLFAWLDEQIEQEGKE